MAESEFGKEVALSINFCKNPTGNSFKNIERKNAAITMSWESAVAEKPRNSNK